MVEGHSVHRVAARHRQKLVGKKFACTSPNGRFTEGAAAINNKTFRAIEAVGKNLFAWFGKGDDDDVESCVEIKQTQLRRIYRVDGVGARNLIST